jgi:hypothetical protein
MQKRSDSLRAIGVTTLSLDKNTKAELRRLAGDSPLSEYIKGLVNKERELALKGV